MAAASPVVRPAGAHDLPALARLWVEFMDYHAALDAQFERSPEATERWSQYIEGKLSDPDYAVLIAELEELSVGYVVAAIRDYPPISNVEQYGFIQDMAVTEACRRQGIGRALYGAAEEWILDRGVGQIELKVDVRNEVSRSFWLATGFAPHTETLIKRWPSNDP